MLKNWQKKVLKSIYPLNSNKLQILPLFSFNLRGMVYLHDYGDRLHRGLWSFGKQCG